MIRNKTSFLKINQYSGKYKWFRAPRENKTLIFAEGPRDAQYQLRCCQLLHNCTI